MNEQWINAMKKEHEHYAGMSYIYVDDIREHFKDKIVIEKSDLEGVLESTCKLCKLANITCPDGLFTECRVMKIKNKYSPKK
jgi:hypothetical protein